MDVLEIDAATHTGIDNVREVIISGLGILPVRDRFKVFIIDEVHQLSASSFNALLKSIEEPPAHVVFMMATTELDKIPETILSRSQVYEFRTISGKAITDQLRRIVDADGIEAGDDALRLVARDAEGSMRDAQSKLDQVIAFTGTTISAADVATVLGLVGRDLLIDAVQAVADENAAAAFDLAARAVEMGYDLRAVCRELTRTVRDLMVLSVDPSRVNDPEIAGEGDRERLTALVKRFSREDLLRAFDLLARAETDIRFAAQPRYHLEMVLLRWIHLRKLVPIEDLIAGTASAAPAAPVSRARAAGAEARPAAEEIQAMASAAASTGCRARRAARRRHPAAAAQPPAVASGFSRTEAKPDVALQPDGGQLQGRVSRGDSQEQARAVQHVCRAGAEDRGQRRPGRVHVLGEPARAARPVRAESRLARIGGAAGRRTEDRGRGRPARGRARAAGGPAPPRRPRIGRPSSASRRWPSPASRRCSKCSRRKYGM